MAIKDTCKSLKSLLDTLQGDLDKAEAGNKAAAQRVRTGTIRLEKAAKLYRKESIKADKNGFMKKAKEQAKKKPAPKATLRKASMSAPSKRPTPVAVKRIPSAKAPAPKKRATAKLPKRKKR